MKMDLAVYIKECKLVLERTNRAEKRNTKSKFKALKILDDHEKKWNHCYEEIVYAYLKYEEVSEIYSDVSYQWRIIHDSLTDAEGEEYGETLNDEYDELTHCKDYKDWVDKCFASAKMRIRNEKKTEE
jgi:hypothetical protein